MYETIGQATVPQLVEHLKRCDANFSPPLSTRVSLDGYASKLLERAVCLEIWDGDNLVASVAMYCGEDAFISNVSVDPRWKRRGIASRLIQRAISIARKRGLAKVRLEVGISNVAAVALYQRVGFSIVTEKDGTFTMELLNTQGLAMTDLRNYDQEWQDTPEHKYAYRFDFDVMHPYMLRSFEPFFRSGCALELGSFRGDFTRRLLAHFDDLTCVEASAAALSDARSSLGDRVTYFHDLFETVVLPRRYDNIILTHVLEHLDDPIAVLRRVNNEWLAEDGRFFLVCPNANAPSRQIAVKMGLISHNAAVTTAEKEHGHRITYSLDTLERDATEAGLRVVHRSGIFFKALANFQWDRLLATDIISKEYLEGCFQLGQIYPDLCSSVFLVCERGAVRSPSPR